MSIKVKKSIADRKLLWLYHEGATVRVQFFDYYVRITAGETETKFSIPESCMYKYSNKAIKQSEQSEQANKPDQLSMFLNLCNMIAYGAQPTNSADIATMNYAATSVPVGSELFYLLEEYKKGDTSFVDIALKLSKLFTKEN